MKKTQEEYRMLEPGETIQKGDEFLVHNSWVPSRRIGAKAWAGRYRRKELPDMEGYRLLELTDTIKDGDQFFARKLGQWRPTSLRDRKVSDVWKGYRIFRRKIRELPDMEGYRFLRVGETIQKGDEFLDDIFDEWKPSKKIGSIVGDGKMYRRKIQDPAPGYCETHTGQMSVEGSNVLTMPRETVFSCGNAPWNTDDKFKPAAPVLDPWDEILIAVHEGIAEEIREGREPTRVWLGPAEYSEFKEQVYKRGFVTREQIRGTVPGKILGLEVHQSTEPGVLVSSGTSPVRHINLRREGPIRALIREIIPEGCLLSGDEIRELLLERLSPDA